MQHKKPPFDLTNTILDKVAEIAELIDQVNAASGLSVATANRILAKLTEEASLQKIRVG